MTALPCPARNYINNFVQSTRAYGLCECVYHLSNLPLFLSLWLHVFVHVFNNIYENLPAHVRQATLDSGGVTVLE